MTTPTTVHVAHTGADVDRLLSVAVPTAAVPLAGGTDLLVQRRSGRIVPAVVDLTGIGGPAVTEVEGDTVQLSATAPLTDIATGLDGRFPALDRAIAVFASETIRNRATIGGNLATGSPAADTVPALLAADATVRLRRRPDRQRPARRDQPLAEFLLGPRRVDLRAGEWIESVLVPAPPAIGGMRKVAGRAAQAISLVSLAWQWEADTDHRLRAVRLAVGAAAPTVVRLHTVEQILEGATVAAGAVATDTVERAAAAVADDIAPIDDLRASAGYRLRCAAGLLREILLDSPGHRPDHPPASEPDRPRSNHR